MLKTIFAATIAMLLLAALPARADNALAGIWKIERAEPAPWVDATFKPDQKEVATYVGKTVKFLARSIKGPALLACPDPNFEMKDYSGDMICQGGLGEFFKDAAKAEEAATKLGFKTRPIKTLETGCEHEFDFHMTDTDHAAFALDNMIYWLKRTQK
ncbi:MAG: hypothetical protein K8S25_09750 [Alphaproteobacteria bacterium]|nr:hypothetical protein [Alphaproteobacteria bacterium]